jgi:hypothetical protein
VNQCEISCVARMGTFSARDIDAEESSWRSCSAVALGR